MLTWIWQRQVIGVDQRREAGEYANYATEDSDADYEHFPNDCVEVKQMPLELHVEDTWPHERQHHPRERPDQTHQYSEVRDRDCQQGLSTGLSWFIMVCHLLAMNIVNKISRTLSATAQTLKSLSRAQHVGKG